MKKVIVALVILAIIVVAGILEAVFIDKIFDKLGADIDTLTTQIGRAHV